MGSPFLATRKVALILAVKKGASTSERSLPRNLVLTSERSLPRNLASILEARKEASTSERSLPRNQASILVARKEASTSERSLERKAKSRKKKKSPPRLYGTTLKKVLKTTAIVH